MNPHDLYYFRNVSPPFVEREREKKKIYILNVEIISKMKNNDQDFFHQFMYNKVMMMVTLSIIQIIK